MTLHWYFDYLSPFAYLQFAAHPDLMTRPDVELRPVLFAGLLNHWGHKGPAEIPPKKVHTFRLCTWQAAERGIPIKNPPAHPFRPLPALRLTIALGSRYDVVKTIFDFIWRDGRSVDDEWPALLALLGVSEAAPLLADDRVKATLRANGEAALAAGVFGVPTFVADKALFWGEDATGMLRAYLANPKLFDTPEMRRIDTLPVAASRIK
jgi:2-hydroxychromene-2-carboxylate isomerase